MGGGGRLSFGDFVIDAGERRLLRGGRELFLRPKTFAILEYLVERAGRLVTKEELLDAVWPDVVVSEGVLKVCIREARDALEDDAKSPRYIETRHRIGYRFIARAEDESVIETGPRWFVGRSAQLSRLAELRDRVVRGESGPRIIGASGEAGFGKTALAEELLRRSSVGDTLCCMSACVERHGTLEAFFPFLEGLLELAAADERVKEHLRANAPTWCAQLPSLFPSDARLADETLGATRPRMLRELGSALRAISAERPLVWVVEDLHWADPSSIDLLRHIGVTCAKERLLLVATFRPSAIADASHPLEDCMRELETHGRAATLDVGPLSKEDVAAYLGICLDGAQIGEPLVALLANRTEGHPLFLASLVEHLRGIGGFRRDHAGRMEAALSPEALRREVPSDVRSMVQRKLSSIDAETRNVLTFAAVLGPEPISDVLAALLERAQHDVEERLSRAFRVHQLLARPEEVTSESGAPALKCHFAHVLYRDALYESLVPSRRVELHRRAGEIIEERHPKGRALLAGQLAHHFAEGRVPKKAVSYWGTIAENAEARLAIAEAATACDRAIALVERLPEAERSAAAIRFLRRRTGLRMAAGRFAEASADLDALRAHAESSGDAEAQIDARMMSFRQLGYLGAFDAARATADDAIRIAEARGLVSRKHAIEADVASLLGLGGQLAQSTALLAPLVEIRGEAAPKPRAPLLLDLGSYLSMQGRHAEALVHIDELLVHAKEASDGLRFSAGLLWRGHALANRGSIARAIETLEEGVRLTRANEDRFILPRLLACLGWVHREMGAFERALEWDQRALDMGLEVMPDARAHALIDSALNRVELGARDAATSALADADALIAQPCFGDWLVRARLADARARASFAAGDLEEASRQAKIGAERAEVHDLAKKSMRAALIDAQILLAREDPPAAVEAAEAIVERLEARPLPLFAWRVHMLLARAYRAADRAAEAKAAADHASVAVAAILGETPPGLRSSFEMLHRTSR